MGRLANARGVLASDRPVLDDFRPVFRFVLMPPPLFIARFNASARRFQPFGGPVASGFRYGLKGPRPGTPAPVGRSCHWTQ